MIMKYWGFLLLKLAAGALVMLVVWRAIVVSFRGTLAAGFEQKPFGHDLGFTSAMLLFFLACFGLLHLIVWDQRYRCRTCLRRLRMPVHAALGACKSSNASGRMETRAAWVQTSAQCTGRSGKICRSTAR